MEPDQTDTIRLTVPATPTAVRIIRVGASALATRAGFSYGEAEELRLAVGEAAAVLAGGADGHGDIAVTYDVRTDGVDVRLRLTSAAARIGSLTDVSTAMLDASVDRWRLVDSGRGLLLHKALPELDDDDAD